MSTQTENPQIDAPALPPILKGSANRQWLTALAPVWTLIAMIIFFALASPTFLRGPNLNNILVQISTLAIFGTGMTFVLLTGEIDLSIAAIAGLSGMIAAYLFHNLDVQEPIPLLAGLGAATLLGFLSGIASTRFRIPTFMATLAMSYIAGGLNTYVSKGRTISNLPEISKFLGSGRIPITLGPIEIEIRVIIIVAALSLLIGYLVLRYTRFGRYVYMTGASKPAARLVGVNTDRILVYVLTFSGFMSGLAGIVSMGRLGSAYPDVIPSYLIDTIATVVLGGTLLTGGKGGIPQTVIGLLLYGTLRNGLDNIRQIDPLLKDFIVGVVLLGALVINLVFSGRAPRDKVG
ncbi:MAG TPA: ABC transporter permease [Oceanobacillus sp.]|nr:ABC transporter permease [Oceanobacillus sp.]